MIRVESEHYVYEADDTGKQILTLKTHATTMSIQGGNCDWIAYAIEAIANATNFPPVGHNYPAPNESVARAAKEVRNLITRVLDEYGCVGKIYIDTYAELFPCFSVEVRGIELKGDK